MTRNAINFTTRPLQPPSSVYSHLTAFHHDRIVEQRGQTVNGAGKQILAPPLALSCGFAL